MLCMLLPLLLVAGCSESGEPEAGLAEYQLVPEENSAEKNGGKELILVEQAETVRHESKPQLDRAVPGSLETATFAMG